MQTSIVQHIFFFKLCHMLAGYPIQVILPDRRAKYAYFLKTLSLKLNKNILQIKYRTEQLPLS